MTSNENNLFTHLIRTPEDGSTPALRWRGGPALSYAELDQRSARYAHVLNEAGLRRGDRLVALTDKSTSSIVLYLAALRAGAIYVPLNPSYTSAEVGFFISDAFPAVIVTDLARRDECRALSEGTRAAVIALDGTTHSLEQLARMQDTVCAPAAVDADDTAAILYTSGTTGRSKGAMLSHGNLLANAESLREAWRFTSEDVLLHALPLFHTHGLFVGLNVSLLAGATVDLLPGFDAEEIVSRLPQATVLMGVPTYYTRLLTTPGLRVSCSHVRLFISGSAPLLSSVHREWTTATGHQILERYGMTETTMLTSNPLEGERRPGTVGTALPRVRVRIWEPDDDGIGSIHVAGPNVFSGYWRLPERTRQDFTDDGFFITGDLGQIDEAGYLQIVGRQKDLVITGGYNVYPKEIETVIDAFEHVSESAVFGVPDADLGEKVVAAVVPEPGAPLDEDALTAHLVKNLARYKRPRTIMTIAELPRNVMGKVQKNILRESRLQDEAPTT